MKRFLKEKFSGFGARCQADAVKIERFLQKHGDWLGPSLLIVSPFFLLPERTRHVIVVMGVFYLIRTGVMRYRQRKKSEKDISNE